MSALRSASAADASPWDGDSRAAVRLIAGAADAPAQAAIEIWLAPGWKTYWRYPGDSGVPPRFDFSGSENVASAGIEWPAPRLFSDQEGKTIGYKEHVTFPLRVVAAMPGRPVLLRAKVDYAICEKLCVPAEARVELPLAQGSPDNAKAIAAARQRVPKIIPPGSDAPLAVASVRRETGSPARVVIEINAPAGAPLEVFAEGPSPDWALPVPEPAPGATPGRRRYSFALDGLPPGAKPDGAELRVTAVAGEAAAETAFRLD